MALQNYANMELICLEECIDNQTSHDMTDMVRQQQSLSNHAIAMQAHFEQWYLN